MLNGKRIIITGAASGMGQAIARHFAEAGAKLVLTDINREGLEQTAQALSAKALVLDLSDDKQITPTVESGVQALGGLDGVVNAAGLIRSKTFLETDADIWRLMFSVNLLAPVLIGRAAAPHLRASGGGTIVNIASMGGMRPVPMLSAYGASKAGLISVTSTMAVELAPDIRVNAICPGPIDTPMTQNLWGTKPGETSSKVQNVAMKRAGTVDEIAAAALFLTSDASSYINGIAMPVDGGKLA